MDVEMLPPCGHVIAGSRNFAGCGPSAYFISLPSVVAISLVEVEIILIFNARRRIHMNILFQSVTIQFRRLFWHISYLKVRQSDFITKCDRQLLQSSSATTKCYRLYYKVRQVLQSVSQTTPPNICTTFTFMTQGTKFLFIVISSARSKYTVCITLHINFLYTMGGSLYIFLKQGSSIISSNIFKNYITTGMKKFKRRLVAKIVAIFSF